MSASSSPPASSSDSSSSESETPQPLPKRQRRPSAAGRGSETSRRREVPARAAGIPRGRARASRPAAAAGSKAKGPSFERQSGHEYQKHLAFRKDHGLEDAQGKWTYSEELLGLEPAMRTRGVELTARARDLLHIIWLLFEKRGAQASKVVQAWMLCQSIWHGRPPFAPGFFKGKFPNTPGLHLAPRGRHARQALAPCVLPHCQMWLNARRQFAQAVELLAMQGLHAPTLWPEWQKVPARTQKCVAGNMTTLPVIGWYLLLSIVGILPRRVQVAAEAAAAPLASEKFAPGNYEPKSLAEALVSFLESRWPEALKGCGHGQGTVISIGSLCSGADFVKDFFAELAAAVSQTSGKERSFARVQILDKIACESDRGLWLAAKTGGRSMPVFFYPNVHTLPLQDTPTVDICVITGMCTAISGRNRKRMSLRTPDPQNVSKATVDSCLRYVKAKMPSIVIMENVATLTWRRKVAGAASAPSSDKPDVDYILEQLAAMKYVCGYDLQDSCNWWVPQTRLRTYVWAHKPGLPGAAAFGDTVRCRTPGGPVLPLPLASSLVP